MPSLNQHNMSRRGFCLCCMGATTLAATGVRSNGPQANF